MACTISLAAIFLTFFNAVNGSFQPLNPLEQLQKRNPYYGGYAIPQPPLGCPTNLETCQDSFCCPTGTWCGPNTNGAYCCPTGNIISLFLLSTTGFISSTDNPQRRTALLRLTTSQPAQILAGAYFKMYSLGVAKAQI